MNPVQHVSDANAAVLRGSIEPAACLLLQRELAIHKTRQMAGRDSSCAEMAFFCARVDACLPVCLRSVSFFQLHSSSFFVGCGTC